MAKRRSKQLTLSKELFGLIQPKDPALAEAMREAREIREWTDGPKPATWRIYRLAQALRR